MYITQLEREQLIDESLYVHKDCGCLLARKITNSEVTCENCPFTDCIECLPQICITALLQYDKINEIYKADELGISLNGKYSAKYRTYWVRRKKKVTEVYRRYGLV